MNKVLSIIVPSYNMEAYLDKDLNTLVVKKDDGTVDEELMSALEVLVINDGSKDRTSEIGHAFEAKYPNTFRVIDKENGHYGSCVNRGLKEATGFYVRILDADDYVDVAQFRGFLEKVREESLKAEDAADLIVTNFKFVDSEGNVIKVSDCGFKDDGYYTLDNISDVEHSFESPHAVTYKSCNLRNIGYHQTDGQMYTDNEWVIEPMITVNRMLFLHSAVVCYLLGRFGQSMEEETYLSHFQQVVNVALSLAEKYDRYLKIATKSALGYYQQKVFFVCRIVYTHLYWHLCGISLCQADFIAFDIKLKELSSQLYQETEKITKASKSFPFKYFPWYYVREWRKAHSLPRWKFAYVSCMAYVRSRVCAICKSIKNLF